MTLLTHILLGLINNLRSKAPHMHTLWQALKRFDRAPTNDEIAVAGNKKPASCLSYPITGTVDAIFESAASRNSAQSRNVRCSSFHIIVSIRSSTVALIYTIYSKMPNHGTRLSSRSFWRSGRLLLTSLSMQSRIQNSMRFFATSTLTMDQMIFISRPVIR